MDIVTGKAIAVGQNEEIKISKHLKSPTLMMLVLIAALGAINYCLFLLNPGNRGDLLPYILVISAEAFIIIQALLSLWTVLASSYNPRNFEFHNAQDNLFGPHTKSAIAKAMQRSKFGFDANMPAYIHTLPVLIDVFVTVYGESLSIVRRTVTAARDMMGAHTTYVLDDGDSAEIKALCKELGVKYLNRPTHEHAKAGNINYALSRTKGEFYVIFDADFVPSPLFLYETMPFMENSRVAFVQTPQYYSGSQTLIAKGAGFMQHVFYALIQPGKNRFNAAFCVGTNVVFRRSATNSIGGIYQKSKSEDIWTSILLHEKDYESVYIPNVLAVGKTPDTIKAYSRQQLRWATGGFEIFLRHNPLLRRGLTIDQRVQYLATVSHYFNGFAVLLLLALPPLQIFFNLSPVNLQLSNAAWAYYYSSFYVMQIFVAFYTMGGFKFQTLVLANASAPIYIKAFFNALRKRDRSWQATGTVSKTSRADSPFNYIFAQVYIFVFLLLTSVVGIWKADYTDAFSVSLLWNSVNTLVFGSFLVIAFRESRQSRAIRRAAKRREVKTVSLPAPAALEVQTT